VRNWIQIYRARTSRMLNVIIRIICLLFKISKSQDAFLPQVSDTTRVTIYWFAMLNYSRKKGSFHFNDFQWILSAFMGRKSCARCRLRALIDRIQNSPAHLNSDSITSSVGLSLRWYGELHLACEALLGALLSHWYSQPKWQSHISGLSPSVMCFSLVKPSKASFCRDVRLLCSRVLFISHKSR